MQHNLIYKLQWAHYKMCSKVKNPDTLLSALPQNLLQLNFWCEVMLLAKSQSTDVVEDAVFYLSDGTYDRILEKIPQADRNSVFFKIKLARHMFLQKNQSLTRIMEQTIMTAFATNNNNSTSQDKIKIKVIADYLQSQSHFLSQKTLQKISEHLANNIHPQKQLTNVNDIILGNFLVQQLAINSAHNNQQIIKFLTLYKKYSVVWYLLDYIMKYDKMDVIDLVVKVAEKLDRMDDIVKIFGLHRQKFYRMFWLVLEGRKEMEYQYFINFMMEYSSVRAIVLHQILYSVGNRAQPSQNIEQMINQQNPQLFTLFKTNPEQTSKKCIQIYLKLTNFHIPKQKIGQSYSDPLAAIAIVRRYWQHEFHGDVINYCIWVLLDVRFCKVGTLKCRPDQAATYRRNLYLALAHIAMTYKISTIINYYPIEYDHLSDIFRLQSLTSLLNSVQNLPSILWLPLYANSQLYPIIRSQNGYTLLLKLLQTKIGNYNYANILHHMEYDITNMKNKSSKASKILRAEIRGVLRFLQDKKAIKDQVDKLIKAIQFLDREYQ